VQVHKEITSRGIRGVEVKCSTMQEPAVYKHCIRRGLKRLERSLYRVLSSTRCLL
jgi:hypothetical protein